MSEDDTTDDIELDPQQVMDRLAERSSNWRGLLEEIAYDPEFAALYAPQAGLPVTEFLYDGHVFFFRKETLTWDMDTNVLRWLLSHAKREWAGVASLYEYSQGISEGKSPWLLFQYITGIAETTQGMGLNSLMGIGTHDAEHLSLALENWSIDKTEVEMFVELVLMHESGALDG